MNKYREAHPEWFDEKGRVQPWVLRELLSYDPETGDLRWRERGAEWFLLDGPRLAREVSRWNNRFSEKNCGCLDYSSKGKPTLSMSLFGKKQSVATIAFTMANCRWPVRVYSIDGNIANIRLANLTEKREILREVVFFKTAGTSIYCGVWKPKGRNRYVAAISINGKQIKLGSFKTEEDAADAYDAAALKYLGPTAYLNMAVNQPRDRGIFVAPADTIPTISDADDF